MPDPRTDEIAREAARLIQTGRAEDIDEATRRAAETLGYSRSPLPGAGRVRKHAQAMSMQALGDAAYLEERLKVWQIAEQMMTVFEHTLPDARSLLVGRAAQGLIDAGVTIHIRLYTRLPITDLAQSLMDFGYEDPQFTTMETRFGRLQQIRVLEEGHEMALTRCVPEMMRDADFSADLTSGKPIATLTLPALRRKIDEHSKGE